jgi:predicted phosphodiesterase
MRYALLADVHGNLEALQSVLSHVRRRGGAQIAVAGDLVGYGPDPSAVIGELRDQGAICVAGNHEGMVLGHLGFDRCVHSGIRAALWTRRHLNALELQWLAALPSTRSLPSGVALCHGDLDDCQRYVSATSGAHHALARLEELYPEADVLVCGHTHQQFCFAREEPREASPVGVPLRMTRGRRFLVNPGGVGQSRDARPLARYAMLDIDAGLLTFFEVPYDVARTRAKMRRVGLVADLSRIERSAFGRRVDHWKTRIARWAAAHAARPSLGTPYRSADGASGDGANGHRRNA